MRLRRKSVNIVVAGDGERARPETNDVATTHEPSPPGDEAGPAPAADGATAPVLPGTGDVPSIPTLDPIPGPAPMAGNGADEATNGAGPGPDTPVGVPFGAAVATFERPAEQLPTPAAVAPPAGPAPLVPGPPGPGLGGVGTLAPPLAPPSAPAATSPPISYAPAAPAAPIAYAPPAPDTLPTPSAAAPVIAPDSGRAANVPIDWTAPGWEEYRCRLAAAAASSAADVVPMPNHAPVRHVVSSPVATPAAAPPPAAVASGSAEPSVDGASAGDTATGVDAAAVAPTDVSRPPGAPSQLGEMLLTRGMVTREQLDQALAEQAASGMRIGTQLVSLGFVTERDLIEVLAEQLDMPVSDLRLVAPEPEAVALVPEDLARRLEIVPVRMTPAGLEVARADALSDEERREIEAAVEGTIVPVLATPSEIQRAIDSTYQALAGMAQQVQAYADLAKTRTPVETGTQIVVDDRAPVVQVVTLLLTQAVRDRTSDIHIEPQDGDVRVRFRIDGVLRDVTTIPAAMAQALISRIKVMADMNIVERRRSQDGQITTEIDGRPLDVRVATTATIWGEKAVLRLLDKTRSLRALKNLGMSPETARAFSDLVVSPFGMVICAGPTGSGKTTTLYAALNEINSPERNITTIEDPVEYVLPRINQIQVNRQAGITFADGLKSIMRQDPDVILVGEIRDVETARIAVQSALTGHFVLSSLHATDCATALQRFRDMGIEPFLINSSVLALEAQRLVRRICVHCREPYEPTAAERAFFLDATGFEKETWTHGAGCNLCSHTGYSERIGVYELMRITDEIQELVLADAGHDEIQAVATRGGMRTLKDEAVRLVAEDVTTVAEAFRSVYTR